MHAVLYSSSYSMHVVLKIVKCPDIPTFRARNIDIANIRVRIILYTTRTAILTKYAATFVTSKDIPAFSSAYRTWFSGYVWIFVYITDSYCHNNLLPFKFFCCTFSDSFTHVTQIVCCVFGAAFRNLFFKIPILIAVYLISLYPAPLMFVNGYNLSWPIFLYQCKTSNLTFSGTQHIRLFLGLVQT